MDAKKRRLLSYHRMQHSKADPLYVPRAEEGSGLVPLELCCKTTAIGQQRDLETAEDFTMICVKAHEGINKLCSVI